MNESQHYRQVPNLNFIPAEFQRGILPSRQTIVRFIIGGVIGIVFVTTGALYRDNQAMKSAMDAAQLRIEETSKRLTAVNLRRDEATKIQAEIDAVQKDAVTLKEEYRYLQDGQGWPKVFSTVFQSRTKGVDLSSMAKQGTNLVSVSGNATSYSALLEYRSQLLASSEISRIVSLASQKDGASFTFSIIAQVEPGIRP